jgi:hypothetical protein
MGFNLVVLRDAEDTDGRIWPVMASEPDAMLIEREDLDGDEIVTLPVVAAAVCEVTGGGLRQLAKISNLSASLYITGQRVAFACSKLDKGGGWVGFGGTGLAVALPADAVSKVSTASRRRGKIVAAQLRYPWLKSVHAHPQTRWSDQEQLRLGFATRRSDGDWRPYVWDITLPPRTVSSMDAAQDIIRRAAAFRLEHWPVLLADHQARLTELARADPLEPPPPGKFAGYAMPVYSAARTSTAFPPGYASLPPIPQDGQREDLSHERG